VISDGREPYPRSHTNQFADQTEEVADDPQTGFDPRHAYLLLETQPNGSIAATGRTSFTINRGPQPPSPTSFVGDGDIGRSSWRWDGVRLRARTSDTGYVPLYYLSMKDGFVISPSFRLLRERFSDGEIDWPAVVICLLTGKCIESDTPFADIRALPLRATLTWSLGRLSVDQALEPETSPTEDYDLTLGMYVSQVDAAVRRSITDRPYSMGLTGGRDSRHILLALNEHGSRPAQLVTGNHYLAFSDGDTEIARALSERVGLPITTVDPQPDRIRAEIEKNWQTEFQTLPHSWGLAVARTLSATSATYIGMDGGTLFGRSTLVKEMRRRYGGALPPRSELRAASMAFLLDRPLDSLNEILAKDLISREDVEEARRRMARSVEKYEAYPNPSQAFKYFNATTRGIGPFTYGMLRNAEVICPLDDPEVVRFALALPWSVSSRADLQTNAIRRYYEAFADIPFVEDYTPKSPSVYWDPDAERRTIAELARRLEQASVKITNVHGMELLEPGAAQLGHIQILVYLWQLLAWNEGQFETLSDPSSSPFPSS
jgi:asparagine synthetase B (glutamine-hydrolysing)